ncbi:MAG: MarR family winged helix-turn-helix transcriptional regulator [Armatimonadota bacterium]
MAGFDPAMKAWTSFVRAKAEIHRTVGGQIRERGLTGSQLGILKVLAEASDEGLKLNEISQRLFVTPGNLTGLVDRLEEAGFLQRSPHPEDRRATLAVLTPSGRELFEQLAPAHTARVTELMSALSASEQDLLAELLARLATRASEMREGEQS